METWGFLSHEMPFLNCIFKKTKSRGSKREDWPDVSTSVAKPASSLATLRPCLSLWSPFQLAWGSQQRSLGQSNSSLSRKAVCSLSLPANPGRLLEVRQGGRGSAGMSVHAHSPKGQAPPPNQEQLLNHTEHQQRQKMDVRVWKIVLTYYAELCVCLQKPIIKKWKKAIKAWLCVPKHRKEPGLYCHCCFSSPIIEPLLSSSSSLQGYV